MMRGRSGGYNRGMRFYTQTPTLLHSPTSVNFHTKKECLSKSQRANSPHKLLSEH